RYSVKSTYHMLKEEDNNNQPESSSVSGKELWKSIVSLST
ncbi:hypothetical protein A2U01_0057602, partial [Trifolium medium]|nr:hypothetical protein [Trifolium medium]